MIAWYDVTHPGRVVLVELLRDRRKALDPRPRSLVVLAGGAYVRSVVAAADGIAVRAPFQELPKRGYGYYRQWLRETMSSRHRALARLGAVTGSN